MPGGKKANVKNEKQYEALKDKGMSKERAAKIAKLARGVQARWPEQRQGWRQQSGWHDRAEEEGRTQGREGQPLIRLADASRPCPRSGDATRAPGRPAGRCLDRG